MNNFAVVTIFLLVLAAGAGVFFYMNYYQPLVDEAEKIKTEIDDLERQKAQLANIEEEMAQLKAQISKLTEQKNKLQMESNQLNTVVPKLLDSTETIANKFKVKFQDIRISPLVRAEDWSELPVEMTILGTFKDIGLTIMEKRKIINLAAGSMNVSVSAEVDRDSKSPLLSVTLSAKVYIMGGGY